MLPGLPPTPGPGQFFLITDQLSSSAEFIIHRALSGYFKSQPSSESELSQKQQRCILVSVTEDFEQWKSIAARSSLNLSQRITAESFVFVDGLRDLSLPSPPPLSLRPLYDRIVSALSSGPKPKHSSLVLVDDIATLEWIGFEAEDIVRFSRALQAQCRKNDAGLIILHHTLSSENPSTLLRHLMDTCLVHVDVSPLASGRSAAISGEITIRPGFLMSDESVKLVPKSKALQYRLTDSNALFFEKGLGAGVL